MQLPAGMEIRSQTAGLGVFGAGNAIQRRLIKKKNVSTGVIHWKLPGGKMLPLSIIPDGYVAYQPSPGLLAPHGF